jgi:hypothetical protein
VAVEEVVLDEEEEEEEASPWASIDAASIPRAMQATA